jgi:hypothetical protein
VGSFMGASFGVLVGVRATSVAEARRPPFISTSFREA